MEHRYLESGWCVCGHHRDDGHNERDEVEPLDRTEIRRLLETHGPTYEPKGQPA